MLVLWQRGYLKKLMRMVIHQEPGFDNDGFGHGRVGENEEAYSTSERMVPTEANNNPRLDCKCFFTLVVVVVVVAAMYLFK